MNSELRRLELELMKVVKTQKQLLQQWQQLASILAKVVKSTEAK